MLWLGDIMSFDATKGYPGTQVGERRELMKEIRHSVEELDMAKRQQTPGQLAEESKVNRDALEEFLTACLALG